MKKKHWTLILAGLILVTLVALGDVNTQVDLPAASTTPTNPPSAVATEPPSGTPLPTPAMPTPAPSPTPTPEPTPTPTPTPAPEGFELSSIPAYSGSPTVKVNGNSPYFAVGELTSESYEYYSDLDALGRCCVAYACIGKDLMPTTERGEIGMIRPSGWHTIRYDDLIEDRYLYNRCHLIGYQLTGENANEKNLFTGTRYLNIEGMLPIENTIASYIRKTGNHVFYRATLIYDGDNLLASGVLMEAYSVEDNGKGICLCIYAYNVQPHIVIDYATGDSKREEDAAPTPTPANKGTPTYIGNKNSKKFHYPDCSSVDDMKERNKVFFYGDRSEPVDKGYSPCGRCQP